jgi:hypothetical protein
VTDSAEGVHVHVYDNLAGLCLCGRWQESEAALGRIAPMGGDPEPEYFYRAEFLDGSSSEVVAVHSIEEPTGGASADAFFRTIALIRGYTYASVYADQGLGWEYSHDLDFELAVVER